MATTATAALAAGLLGAAPAHAVPPETLFPQQGNAGYDVSHYGVRMHYDPATNIARARVAIDARARKALDSFSLDYEGPQVTRVVVDGAPATFERHDSKLDVTPARPLARGTFRAVVSYVGEPPEHTDPDGSSEGWVRTRDGATALGEPVGTMTWLPSDDTPGDKATMDVSVTAPSRVQVASNGRLVQRARHTTGPQAGTTTWHWRASEPMAAYLAMVSIGRFDVTRATYRSVDGRRIPIWSFVDPRSKPVPTNQDLEQVMRFEERRFGPYPFDAAGFVVDDVGVGYALETQTRPVYDGGAGRSVLVHEMAHQWYGDSATLVDWHDIWLAEGFATYAEWLWDSAHGGPTPAQRFRKIYRSTPASSSLWSPSLTGFTDPADLFNGREYTRGAMAVQALREKIGAADFARLLKAWPRLHRYGSVRTSQLERLAERISGQDLSGLFHDWVALDGKPQGY